jgi:hypothetical protein
MSGGDWGYTPMAAAAELFALAQTGYITIQLCNDTLSSVQLRRTAKSAAALQPEQQSLLTSIFGDEDAKKQAELGQPSQLPVAFEAFTKTFAPLIHEENMISSLQPRELRSRLLKLFLGVSVTGSVIAPFILQSINKALIVWVFFALAWIVLSGFLDDLKHHNYLYTRKGKARHRVLDDLRLECLYANTDSKFAHQLTVAHLPYELLWCKRRIALLSVDQGLHDTKPDWCDGQWPARSELSQGFMRTIKLMAIALSQPEMLQVSPSSLQNGSRGDLIEFDDTVWGISHLLHDGGIGNGDRGDSDHSDAGEGVSDG